MRANTERNRDIQRFPLIENRNKWQWWQSLDLHPGQKKYDFTKVQHCFELAATAMKGWKQRWRTHETTVAALPAKKTHLLPWQSVLGKGEKSHCVCDQNSTALTEGVWWLMAKWLSGWHLYNPSVIFRHLRHPAEGNNKHIHRTLKCFRNLVIHFQS